MSRFPKGIRHRPYRGVSTPDMRGVPYAPRTFRSGLRADEGAHPVIAMAVPGRPHRDRHATLADMEWQMAFEPSRTVTRAFFEHPVNRHTLGHGGYHGKGHWLRALQKGHELAAATGANLRVIELFAALHDSERETGATIPTTDTGRPSMRAPCKESGST